MRNCLVLGSGRSGTSMVTGMLARAGYFLGGALHAPRVSNPKGFFEAVEVNALNEALLEPILEERPALGDGQRWLGVPRPGAEPRADASLEERLRELVDQVPFCFKDPRFSFTLPAWRPLLGRARFVCVFRHPALTAESLLEECRTAGYLRGVDLDLEGAFRLWCATYRAILEEHSGEGEWLFLHYDQALEAEGCRRLGAFLDVEVDADFADGRMRRLPPDLEVPGEALELYEELCRRAGYTAPAAGPARPPVAVLSLVGDGEEPHVADLVADARAQRGVDARLVLIDATEAGELSCEGATVVRAASLSRGASLRAALEQVSEPYVALQAPGARSLPARLAHAIDALEADPAARLATCDLYLTDDHGQYVDRANPAKMGDAPGPFWDSGLVARREVLAMLRPEAFFPSELELLRRLRDEGAALHVEEPGVSAPREAYAARWERSRQDADLVSAHARPFDGPRPELTVSLCTFDRRATLAECLESFCRQALRPGTFEIVLTDDGSTDGTAEMLDGVEFPVPVRRLRQENAGLAAARNLGLAEAEGELVLFVNDDTIAFPDLVERHLHAHHTATGEVAVLGSFEQPAEALDNALMRYLEGSNEVFGYADLTPGERYDGFRFYTCNVSAPLRRVREAGCFDTSFRHYGCEDTDLAFRLQALGLEVLYQPAARANHRHLMDFAELRRRARTVGRAFVRFFRKHPRLLKAWSNERLDRAQCRRAIAAFPGDLRAHEEAAEELARIDVGSLLRLGGEYAAAGADVLARLAELVRALNPIWWQQGYLAGLEEHGLESFAELLADGEEPWPISADSPRRLLAYPRWDDRASLERLFERIEPVVGEGFCALVLRYDPERDGPRDAALAQLEEGFRARFGDAAELEVVLEEAPLDRARLLRLGRSVDALLPLGGEPDEFLDAIGAERLEASTDVAAWRRRFPARDDAPSPDAAPARAEPRPELTVVVPTRDRLECLGGLLACLEAQDLEPERFEVLVVDDGSAQPLPAWLGGQVSFPCRILRQEPGGPARARNLALAEARGEIVLFLNDDARPDPRVLRRHLERHRWAREPLAVLGTFSLLPERLVDSLALHVETSTTLFAQPEMKPGVQYCGMAFCTGNVSVPLACLQAVGGFDESFSYAGGEDTEVGVRLERELGLQVLYEPTIRCGHDHDLDVGQLVRRKRVVGWAAHRMRAKHGDLGGALGRDWPQDEAAWEELRREVDASVAECERLEQGIAEICLAERRARCGPRALHELRPSLERLEHLEFLRGALLAHDGVLPHEVQGRPVLEAPLVAGTR